MKKIAGRLLTAIFLIVLDNYVNAFKPAPITVFYKNSIFVAIVATILNLIICSMAAYVVVRCRFKAKPLITMLFSLGLIIPGAALIQPMYTNFTATHLYNTLTGLGDTEAGRACQKGTIKLTCGKTAVPEKRIAFATDRDLNETGAPLMRGERYLEEACGKTYEQLYREHEAAWKREWQAAKNLLRFRYETLDGARRNAANYGYKGTRRISADDTG